jgi:hypothetical protein
VRIGVAHSRMHVGDYRSTIKGEINVDAFNSVRVWCSRGECGVINN